MIRGDEYFMREAIKEAHKALDAGEVPVGAIVVHEEKIIARAHNSTEMLTDVTAHAEMLAYTAASAYLGSKYLRDCILYVTLEPCTMCAGASYWTQLGKIVFGASDVAHKTPIALDKLCHPKTKLQAGVLARESETLLSAFFEKKRR